MFEGMGSTVDPGAVVVGCDGLKAFTGVQEGGEEVGVVDKPLQHDLGERLSLVRSFLEGD